MQDQLPQQVDHVIDAAPQVVGHSILAGGIIATVWGVLPTVIGALAGFVGLIYYSIVIWESRTIQHWWQNRRMIYRAKKILRLKAQAKVVAAELEAMERVRTAKRVARETLEDAQLEAAKAVVLLEPEVIEEITPIKGVSGPAG